MTTRKCYQCGDEDLAAIREKRNEEIRAYGRKVLADADLALNGPSLLAIDDWDVLDDEEIEEIEVEPEPEPVVEVEPEPVEPEPEVIEPVTEEKPEKKPAPKAPAKK